jgi:hypothetical protein
MYIVRYETLLYKTKEFKFDDLKMAETFYQGIERFKDDMLIVTLELIKGE